MLITKNGKPVAELRAHSGRRAKSPIGLHRGQVRIKGNILAPLGANGFAESDRVSLEGAG